MDGFHQEVTWPQNSVKIPIQHGRPIQNSVIILQILNFFIYSYFAKSMYRKPKIDNMTKVSALYPFLESKECHMKTKNTEVLHKTHVWSKSCNAASEFNKLIIIFLSSIFYKPCALSRIPVLVCVSIIVEFHSYFHWLLLRWITSTKGCVYICINLKFVTWCILLEISFFTESFWKLQSLAQAISFIGMFFRSLCRILKWTKTIKC